MHPAHHIEPPIVHLFIDEVLSGVEYFTSSTIEVKAMTVHVTECYALEQD